MLLGIFGGLSWVLGLQVFYLLLCFVTFILHVIFCRNQALEGSVHHGPLAKSACGLVLSDLQAKNGFYIFK